MHTVLSIHTASAIILPNGIITIANVVHTHVHLVTTSVDANVFKELAARNAPMGTTWIIQNAGVDADKIHLAVRAVTAMDTHTATVTTPNTLVITTISQGAVTGAANTDIGVAIHDPGLIWISLQNIYYLAVYIASCIFTLSKNK